MSVIFYNEIFEKIEGCRTQVRIAEDIAIWPNERTDYSAAAIVDITSVLLQLKGIIDSI